MKKIPVLDTIRYAYSFTFGHLGTVIGLIWLPMVILAIAGYFVMSHYYGTFPTAVEEGNPTAIGQSALIVMGWSVVSLLISAMMYTAVTQQALGLRKGPAVLHFALGAAELRVFGAMIGLAAIVVVFVIAYVLAAGAVGAAALAIKLAVPIAKLVTALVSLALLFALIHAVIRLSFLLIPATVAEGKIGLARGWQLAHGNVWRIVLIGAAVLGPIMLVAMAAEVAILGPAFFLHQPSAPVGDAAAQMRQMAEQMRSAASHLPLLYGLSFLLAPFFMGLGLAPSAFAYRALTEIQNSNFGFAARS